MNKKLLILLCILFSATGFAQRTPDNKYISLDECLRIAREQSPVAKINREIYKQEFWSYKAFQASLMPGVSLNGNIPGFNRSINSILQDDGTQLFVPQNQAFSSGMMSISQDLYWTGGELTVSSGLSRLDVFGDAGYQLWQTSPLLVTLSQPLFRLNQLKWDRRLKPLAFMIAEKKLLEAMEQLNQLTTEAFFNLYLAQINLNNAEINLAINDTIFTISKGRYSVGKIAENDLLQTELAKLNAEMEYETAQLALMQQQRALATLLGLSSSTGLVALPPAEIPDFQVDADFAYQQALQNRSNQLEWQQRMLLAANNLALAKKERGLNADIAASFGLNQRGFSLDEAYESPLDQQTFSIRFSLPIWEWGKNRANIKVAEAVASQEYTSIEQEKQAFQNEIWYSIRDFIRLQEQVSIARKGEEVAEKRFEVAKNRYLIGKIEVTDFMIAQQEKDRAREAYYEMLKNFWTGYYEMRRLTHYDFVEQKPLDPIIYLPETAD